MYSKYELYLSVLPVNQIKQIINVIHDYSRNLKKKTFSVKKRVRFPLLKIAGNLNLHISVFHSSNL